MRRHLVLSIILSSAAPVHGQSLLDPTFPLRSGPGDEYGEWDTSEASVNALIATTDGRILVGGEFQTMDGEPIAHPAALTPEGSLDTSFRPAVDGSVFRFLELGDGRILVGGQFGSFGGQSRAGLAILNTDLSLDDSFIPFHELVVNVDGYYTGFFAIAEQSDSRIVAAFSGLPEGGSIFRFLPDGTQDMSLSSSNRFGTSSRERIWAMLPLSGDRLLVAGTFQTINDEARSALVVLDENGDVSATTEVNLEAGSSVLSMRRDSRGGILVGGLLRRIGQEKLLPFARLTPELEWDSEFPEINWHRNVGTGLFEPFVGSFLEVPGGGWFVGGLFFEVDGYYRAGIVRLQEDGSVDPCFHPGFGFDLNAAVETPIRSMLFDQEGRLLVAGPFGFFDGNRQARGIARLNHGNGCDEIRLFTRLINDGRDFVVGGTARAPGFLHLDASEDLINWWTVDMQTIPVVTYQVENAFSGDVSQELFFRLRKGEEARFLNKN